MGKKTKCFFGLIFCNLYRLLRVFPNNDPIMAFTLPLARQGEWWHSLLFPITAMVSFDIITMRIGIWTLGTSLSYGLIGLMFYKYFKKRKKAGLKTYVKGSIIGVLIFDFLTGPIMSSYVFRMPFAIALIGQIPFTAMHLASATTLAILLTPVLDPQVTESVSSSVSKNYRKVRAFLKISKKVIG